jgi:SAM-dependent methyltransferase
MLVFQTICRRLPAGRRLLWPLATRHSRFIRGYLEGLRGIEIGAAAHNDYGLEAINVDRFASMDTIFKEEERQNCGRKRPVDLVAPGDDLPFKDNAVDFVFASHVIEHFPDPIRALKEWIRVARKYVVLVVPHKERTFDRDRELTSFDELARRHAEGFNSDGYEHWSVWTLETFVELCEHLGLRVLASLDPDDKVGNGFIVVLDARVETA